MTDFGQRSSVQILQEEQVKLLYAGLPSALAANMLLAAILVAVQYPVIAPVALFGWFGMLGLSVLSRAGLLLAWRRAEQHGGNFEPRWLRDFRLGVLASGLIWGGASVMLFPPGDTAHQVFLAFVLAGLSSGAVTTLAADRISTSGFLTTALLPLVTRLMMEGGNIPLAMGVMSALFLGFLLAIASRAGLILHENTQLRIDADMRERMLSQSEARLNQAQKVAHLGSFDWNPVSGALQWSDEHFRLWGLAPKSVTPDYELFRQGIHPEDVAHVEEVLQQALHGAGLYECVHRVVWPDGGEHYIRGKGEVMFDDAGQPIRMIGTVLDISKQKQVQDALLRSETKFRTLYDSTGDAVMLLDEKGFFDCNQATLEMMGCASKEIFCSKHPADLSPPKQACGTDSMTLARQLIATTLEKGSLRFEWMHQRADNGKIFPVEVLLNVMELDGKRIIQAVVRDITERKQDEAALRAAMNAAEAGSRAKSEFLASMSHELRTPLNAILGFSQLLGMDQGLSKDTKDQLGEIEQAGQHLLSLVNDLIDLARIESGKLEVSQEPVPVKAVVNEGLAMVAEQARKQGVRLIYDEGAGESAVQADYFRLRQVLVNLLSNAIKYNRPHGTVRLSVEMNGSMVRIGVADTGPGIPADKQARIFNPFDRLGEERGNIEGTGIGLVITQRIIKAMGGNIGFESVEGEGSTFWIEFPHALSPGAAGRQISRPVVLYIEDNQMSLSLMRHIFAMRKDLELRDAHTAELGIELAHTVQPAMILMDINLPGMDGYAALKVLKADPETEQIPVIAVSANAMKGDEERGLAAGFSAYLTKPLNVAKFQTVMNRLLNMNPAD